MHASIDELLRRAEYHFHANQLEPAAWKLREIIEREPDHPDALEGLAHIAARQGRHALASDYFERVLARVPPDRQRLNQAALNHQLAGRPARAVPLLQAVLALDTSHIPALHALAMAHVQSGQFDAAKHVFEQAITRQPGLWSLHYNLGRVLGSMGDQVAERRAYEQTLRLKPDCVDAYVNLGVAWRDQGHFDKALSAFKKAIQIDPNHAGARTNRAQTNLLLGEFEHGWREYEWRWRDGVPTHGVPGDLWLGESTLSGRWIVLHAEQGYGDTLQFLRYLMMVKALGAWVVLRVPAALYSLLARYPGADVVLSDAETIDVASLGANGTLIGTLAQCPLMSLPYAFKTRLTSIPAPVPYIVADASVRGAWAAKTAFAGAWRADPALRRIGIAWSGEPTHANDRHRSIPLSTWRALLTSAGAPDAIWVALQKEVREDDRATWDSLPMLLDVSDQLDSFADTAALIAELDLIICVDTAVAHLAAAMGKPVWLLLCQRADWRWGLHGAKTPWYPTMRLFRQTRAGDWADVIDEVDATLESTPHAAKDGIDATHFRG